MDKPSVSLPRVDNELQLPPPARALLDELGADQQLSGLGVAVVQILKLLEQTQSAIPQLAHAALGEPFIAQRLLRMANAALIRRGSAPVTQLSKAIVLLGFEQVRMVALSTLVLSKLGDNPQRKRLEAEFAACIYAISLAWGIAESTHLCEPEEAAVCTLFRLFGRLLVGLYRYEQYEQILELSAKQRISANQACVRVLGLSFERIATTLLTRWGLPQRIVQALSPTPEAIRFTTSAEGRLQILSTFCAELALALRERNWIARRRAIEALFRRFGGALRLERLRFTLQLELADAQVVHMSEALGLSECPIASEAFDESDTLTFSPLNRPEASLVLRAGLVTLTRSLAQQQVTGHILKRACDILHRAFAFQRVAIYCIAPGGQLFSLREITGAALASTEPIHLAPDHIETQVLLGALLNNRNVLVRSPADQYLGQSWAAWFDRFSDAKSFVLLPIAHEGSLLALLYADHALSDMQGWTHEEQHLVEEIKGVVRSTLKD